MGFIMTEKVREAFEQEKLYGRSADDIAESLRRIEAVLERRGSPVEELKPFDALEDGLPEDWKYLADRAAERMEQRRSSPLGRAAVKRENEEALKNFMERPIGKVPASPNPEIAEIQQKIRGLNEQYLAQQSILPKPEPRMER
jgi:hypothetical protein